MVVEFTVTKKVTKDPINGSEILDKMESFIGGGEIRGITIKKLDTKGQGSIFVRCVLCVLCVLYVLCVCAPFE